MQQSKKTSIFITISITNLSLTIRCKNIDYDKISATLLEPGGSGVRTVSAWCDDFFARYLILISKSMINCTFGIEHERRFCSVQQFSLKFEVFTAFFIEKYLLRD